MCWHKWIDKGKERMERDSKWSCEHVDSYHFVQDQHCIKCHAERTIDPYS